MTARAPIGERFLQASASGLLVAGGLVLTVPSDRNWKIHSITVELTTSATAGNRRPTIELLTAGDVRQAVIAAGQVQAANLTQTFLFMDGGYSVAGVGSSPLVGVQDILPPFVLLAGQKIRVTDQNGVDAAADTAIVLAHGLQEPA